MSRHAAFLHRPAHCGNVVADLLAEQVPSPRLSSCARVMWRFGHRLGHQLGPAIAAADVLCKHGIDSDAGRRCGRCPANFDLVLAE
jgi:hypothetical protein